MSLKLDVFDKRFPIATGIYGANIHRAEHGELEAEILMNGERIRASRRSGSWSVISDAGETALLPTFAAAVQSEARRLEARERAERDRTEATTEERGGSHDLDQAESHV